jgi:hypothetical protein
MSTKAMFKFYDESDTVYIYKWSNEVNPWNAFKEIKKTFESEYAFKLPRYEAYQFSAAFLMANRNTGEINPTGGTNYRIMSGPDSDAHWLYAVSWKGDYLWIEVFLFDEEVFNGCFGLFEEWQSKYKKEAYKIDTGRRKKLMTIDEMKNLLKESTE